MLYFFICADEQGTATLFHPPFLILPLWLGQLPGVEEFSTFGRCCGGHSGSRGDYFPI